MAHRVLSLKYRPQNFNEITGQEHIVTSLKGAIRSGRIGHAFLFAGPRGVGKTTTARILAKSLNCIDGPTIEPCQHCQVCKEITASRSIDVVEIDGASNRGIDEIRNLREGVRYSPLHGRYKIYIIDEVHMLTQEAFNALLKTLEEPPPKVVFIFATTNPTKIPATILSRCQRFTFKRLSAKEITTRLSSIAEKEGIMITTEALHYLSQRADGSIRDGESILEQLSSFVEGEITEQDVFKLIGFLGSDFYYDLLTSVMNKDLKEVITFLNKGIEDGADPVEIYHGFIAYLRSTLLVKTHVPADVLELSTDEYSKFNMLKIDERTIIDMLDLCLGSEDAIKRSVNVRIALELVFSHLVLYRGTPAQSNNDRVHTELTEKKKTETGTAHEKPIKEQLCALLEKKSPKLAGIVHRAQVSVEGGVVTMVLNNEFFKRQLDDNNKELTAALRRLLNKDIKVDITIKEAASDDDHFIKTIKGLFDGEEVR